MSCEVFRWILKATFLFKTIANNLNSKDMKNGLLLLGMILVINVGCTKDDPQAEGEISVNFSRKALEYVRLPEGTRLVYRDSATVLLDTVVVTKSTLEKISYPGGEYTFLGATMVYPAQIAENFRLHLIKFSGVQQTQWFLGEASAASNYSTNSIPNQYMSLFETYSVGPDNLGLGTTAFYYSDDLIDEKFVSIQVEGKTYDNVLLFVAEGNESDINSPYYRKATYYWAKGFGIIKKKIVSAGGVVKTSTLVSID
jgi:hypothetical protein